MQSQTVFKICEGVWCSSFYVHDVKDFDVIVNKKTFLVNMTLLFFCHSAPHITSEPGGLGGNVVLLTHERGCLNHSGGPCASIVLTSSDSHAAQALTHLSTLCILVGYLVIRL